MVEVGTPEMDGGEDGQSLRSVVDGEVAQCPGQRADLNLSPVKRRLTQERNFLGVLIKSKMQITRTIEVVLSCNMIHDGQSTHKSFSPNSCAEYDFSN